MTPYPIVLHRVFKKSSDDCGYQNHGNSNVTTFRALRGNCGAQDIGKIVPKFEEIRGVTDVVRSKLHRNKFTSKSIASAAESVTGQPNLSVPRRS